MGVSLSFGFGSLSENSGFEWSSPFGKKKSPLDRLGSAMGWMSVAEDLGNLGFHGETAKEMQERQLEAKAQSPNPNDPATYLRPGEPDLTAGVNLERIVETTQRDVTDPYVG
ncbi:MAG: hypothetical protein RBT76_10785, partial [candidate division Zixibacteria bacterium]|nr:hypothetical protein [candidate division Zixibacteria bacterium]